MVDTPTHLFAVGERVSLVGTQLQYRVKAEGEPYERVVTEGQMTRFGVRD